MWCLQIPGKRGLNESWDIRTHGRAVEAFYVMKHQTLRSLLLYREEVAAVASYRYGGAFAKCR